MNIFTTPCPSCGYRFRWIERVRASSRWLGFARRVVTCPGCGASVVWSSRGWRMMIGGTLAVLVLVLMGLALAWDDSLQIATIVWAAFVLLACVVALIGCFTMRFELAGSANKALQATA